MSNKTKAVIVEGVQLQVREITLTKVFVVSPKGEKRQMDRAKVELVAFDVARWNKDVEAATKALSKELFKLDAERDAHLIRAVGRVGIEVKLK